MKPTMEQVKEFWELCGFEYKDYGEYVYGPMLHGRNFMEKAWFAPNGDNWLDDLPPIDLNNLFKYAVPYVKKEYRNWKSVLHDWIDEKDVSDLDAIWLFWIIWELLNEDK